MTVTVTDDLDSVAIIRADCSQISGQEGSDSKLKYLNNLALFVTVTVTP